MNIRQKFKNYNVVKTFSFFFRFVCNTYYYSNYMRYINMYVCNAMICSMHPFFNFLIKQNRVTLQHNAYAFRCNVMRGIL